MRNFSTVAVVGLGTMGAGIAEVLARSGVDVIGVEREPAALDRGRGHVEHSTGRAVRRGKLSEADQAALVARIRFTTDLADVVGADLVVEAVPEWLDAKVEIFDGLDRICRPDTVFATNTSSLSVTEIAASTSRPDRVVGMHFFNPAPVMKLVEVVRTVMTDPAVVADVEALSRRLGKVDVTVGDRAGFVANALLFGYLNHAMRMYESRYATGDDIDAAMRLGAGYPMGPLTLLDLIGLDTACSILETMYDESGDPRHAPAPILRQLVTAGLLGRKSGRGFYTYQAPGSPVVVDGAPEAAPPEAATRPVQRVGIVGTGTTATGIATAAADAGLDVVTAGTSRLNDLADCDLVFVVSEGSNAADLVELMAALGQAVKPGAILATTSSSLPVVACAAASGRPADVVGLHWVDRVPDTGAVEVVAGLRTAPDVAATARSLAARLGRHAVGCGDRAGFIVDALLFPYLNDAIRMVETGYADVDDIDAAMTLGCGLPEGPFEMLDRVGLDVALGIQRALHLEIREPWLAPAPLLEHLVTAGYLGRKTGRGFRDYSG